MAKKKNDDRKAKVEALRREQKRKERIRTWGVLGVCGVLVVALLGFAITKYVKDENAKKRLESIPLSSIGVSKSAASCDPEKTQDATGSGQHIPPPQPITYPTAPPAFGEHWGNFLTGSELRTFYTRQDAPEIERLVHSLEHGHTIIWYDDTVKEGSADYKALQKITTRLGMDSYVFAAPYITKDDGGTFPSGKHIVLTHWTG
ncbi:MAG: hypothetical protein JWO46_3286, partial [Nocardioidaceae bacterium]|nr:hypothetical protein [Nocardioidaceae bacterium]